jgi:hypothetical protein
MREEVVARGGCGAEGAMALVSACARADDRPVGRETVGTVGENREMQT